MIDLSKVNEFVPYSVTIKEMKPPEGEDLEIWWRAEDRTYAAPDPWDDDNRGTVTYIELHPWLVTKTTPKGVWAMERWGNPVFVLGNAIRQTCVPTKELALQDLIARKNKHVQMSESRTASARYRLKLACLALEKVKGKRNEDLEI